MHPPSLALVDTTRHLLEGTARRPTTSQRAALRARIILLAAAGQPVRAVARRLGCQPATVRKWRRRFAAQGVTGLRDADRPGRPRRISAEERCSVIAAACATPEHCGLEGVTEWSARLLAGRLMASGQVAAISARTVQRILAPASVFIAFLDLLDARVPPGQVIHAVVDNLNTHSGPAVAAWQAAHPGRLQLHYLPFYASWLNQIEMWFSTLERRLLRRGDFASADQLEAQILAFIATHNRLFAHPYRWTYTGHPLAA